jgi:hypothetical protein
MMTCWWQYKQELSASGLDGILEEKSRERDDDECLSSDECRRSSSVHETIFGQNEIAPFARATRRLFSCAFMREVCVSDSNIIIQNYKACLENSNGIKKKQSDDHDDDEKSSSSSSSSSLLLCIDEVLKSISLWFDRCSDIITEGLAMRMEKIKLAAVQTLASVA